LSPAAPALRSRWRMQIRSPTALKSPSGWSSWPAPGPPSPPMARGLTRHVQACGNL